MSMECKHVYLDKWNTSAIIESGDVLKCLMCKRVWRTVPKPEWPKQVTLENNEYIKGKIPDLSTEAAETFEQQFSDMSITYNVNQVGNFEILSVDGRKLEPRDE